MVYLKGLRDVLRRYEDNGRYARHGNWEIGTGGYDLNWQISYERIPVIDCIANDIFRSGGTLHNNCMEEKDFQKVVRVIKDIYPDVLTEEEEDRIMQRLA